MHGLEADDEGKLQLYSLPLFKGELPEEVTAIEASPDPAGIAVDSDRCFLLQ